MDRWTVLCEPPWGRTLGDGVWGCASSSLSLHLPPLFSLVWLDRTATYGRLLQDRRVPASLGACTTPPFSGPPSPAPPLGVGRALLCHSCTGCVLSETQPHPEVLAQRALVARDLHLSQVPGDRDAAENETLPGTLYFGLLNSATLSEGDLCRVQTASFAPCSKPSVISLHN